MGIGMSEDVFFTQSGMPASQPQYFDFNAFNTAELYEPPPIFPNPLTASDNEQSMPLMASNTRPIRLNWQDELAVPFGGLAQPQTTGHQHISHYDEEDEDAMSISDDGLPEPSNLRGLQSLSRAWNGPRVEARKFDFFAHSGALFSYMDSPANSELRNRGEITVFAYFLNITSPTISMYERHPCDPVEKQDFHSKGYNLWSCKYFVVLVQYHNP